MRTAVATAETELNKCFDLPETYDPAVRLELLVENGHNARRRFDPAKLEELAASIREKGIIEPLVLRPFTHQGEARFEVVAGARRRRAAQLAGRTAVPAVIREYSDTDVLELQIIENIQREDLDPLEEAHGYKTLLDSDKSKYSAAFIANRIGRSEKYVWDTLRLLNLVPEALAHLEAGRLTRSHANALSRLTANQQQAILDPETGGAFVRSSAQRFNLDADEKPGKYDEYKPVSVKELEKYIADHVRFNAKQASTMALEFVETAKQIETAAAKPGRGKKVISIHFGHHVSESARDANDRTFSVDSWKRADGQDGSKRCELAVLGVVAVGDHYGQAFDVCVAKDTCDVHWKRERKDRARTAELRNSGQPKRAAAREEKVREEREAELAKEEAARKAFVDARPAILEALADKVKTVRVMRLDELILTGVDAYGHQRKQARAFFSTTPRNMDALVRLAAFLVLAPMVNGYSAPSRELLKFGKLLGVDVAAILKQQSSKHTGKDA